MYHPNTNVEQQHPKGTSRIPFTLTMNEITFDVPVPRHQYSPNDSWAKRMRRVVDTYVRQLMSDTTAAYNTSAVRLSSCNGFKVQQGPTYITFTMKKSSFESNVNEGILPHVQNTLLQAREQQDRCGVPPWVRVTMDLDRSKYTFSVKASNLTTVHKSTEYNVKVTLPVPDVFNDNPENMHTTIEQILSEELEIRQNLHNRSA